MVASKKDIEVIEKEIELEYKAALRRDEIKSLRLNRQLKFIAVVMVFYMCAILIALSAIRGDSPLDFFSFGKDKTYVVEDKERTEELEDRLLALEGAIKSSEGAPPLEQRLSLVEGRQNAISETILKDADTALTAKLLREQQKVIASDLDDLKKDNEQLNERMDAFISNLLTIPIVGFFLTLFGGLLTWFVSWIRQKNSKSQPTSKPTQ